MEKEKVKLLINFMYLIGIIIASASVFSVQFFIFAIVLILWLIFMMLANMNWNVLLKMR